MQRLRRRAGRIVRRVRRTLLGKGAVASSANRRPHRPPARVDPVPELEPLPDARYVMLVGAIPPNYGGRAASLLTKCRLLKEIGGGGSTLLTLKYPPPARGKSPGFPQQGVVARGGPNVQPP